MSEEGILKSAQAYSWVISVGLFLECIGFVFRALGAKNQQSEGILTVSELSILLAPLCKCSKSLSRFLIG